MGARERSLRNAVVVFKYYFGLGFCLFGLFILYREHPYASGLISVAFLLLAVFFLSVALVEPSNHELKYRRWFRWQVVSYSEIADCGEPWVYGYIRLRHSRFPWRTIYFVRANASDSLFGLDKTIEDDAVNRRLPEGQQFALFGSHWGKYRRLKSEYNRLYPDGRLLRRVHLLTVLMFVCFLTFVWAVGFFR
jgi:hypothetical protein